MSFNSTVGSRDPVRLQEGNPGNGSTRAQHEVRNLHKSFGSAEILAGLDLMFQDDAITTILGPSGTGKMCWIKHLVGLLERTTVKC